MTEQEKSFFDLLVKRREQRAETINDPEFKNGFENNIDKYTDQAHFVYELLQNADDAGATRVRFCLGADSLVFAHDGKKRFFVSNPDTVEIDKASGMYGSVNSITAIGYSNKPGENAIGKFGIGFMSVFQYTKSPKIYDTNICFQIEQLIVPHLIPDQPELRRFNETTVFVLPFDSGRCSKEDAFSEISRKLRSLSHPLMFLNSLERIDYQIADESGTYQREKTDEETFGDISAKRMRFILCRNQNNEEILSIEEFWFFSRGNDSHNRYSVCFALEKDSHGNDRLKAFDSPAFCFFQTKPLTGLHFGIHAPFLLTDNRESVKAGNEYNKVMIRQLATLAADSLVCLREIGVKRKNKLIEDNILDIIPTSVDGFSDEGDVESISFIPFFSAIRDKMSNEALLPTDDGYAYGKDAYWADTRDIVDLFSNEQLVELSGNPQARWVFRSLARSVLGTSDLAAYVEYITEEKCCEEDWVFRGKEEWLHSPLRTHIIFHKVNSSFVEKQSTKWIHKFYGWLLDSNSRTQKSKKLSIFLNQSKKAVAAFDEDNQPILFLPAEGIELDNVIDVEVLENKRSLEFIEKIGIKKPSLRDYIYNKILPQYQDGAVFDTKPHFKLFFNYYAECSQNEAESFLRLIKHCKFLIFFRGDKAYRDEANHLYFPDPNLRKFFSDKHDTKFVDWDGYISLVGEASKNDLRRFLSALGVNSSARVVEYTLAEEKTAEMKVVRSLGLPVPSQSTSFRKWIYPEIDGASEILQVIATTNDCEKSFLLWRELLEIIKRECNWTKNFESLLSGRCKYFYYTGKQIAFLSPIGTKLRESAWILDCDGRLVSPGNLTVGKLNDSYNLSDDAAKELVRFLHIKEEVPIEKDATLTDEQQNDIALGRLARKYGYTYSELEAKLEREKQQSAQSEKNTHSERNTDSATPDKRPEMDDAREFRRLFERQSPARKAVLENIMRDPPKNLEETLDDENDEETDEYTRPVVDFKNRIKRAEEKSHQEVDQIALEKELTETLTCATKYSFAWFRALMALEAISRNENESRSREITISFGCVELEPSTERTLLLKQPSRNIPHWMEDLAADIPLTLQVKGREHRVRIEVASVKGFALHTRLRNAEAIKGIDLRNATASISVQNPGFLLKSLQDGFASLNFTDDYDLKKNLSENIKFVFGPPGTGKTTYLAREELIPLMQGTEDEKILVLAPTNKAADVLATRIMEIMGEDNSYKNWLVRFGTTFDEKIEESVIYRDRSFYLAKLPRCVFITSVARFPYDSIGGQALREMDWDRVIIDEASMIPIANITYPLYKTKPKQFIIAGDPLQIQPVAQVEQDENIYEMVGLKSFTKPHTEPHNYEVKLLTTQYRSIPSVGEVFSQFAYGGILKHAREEDDNIQHNISFGLNLATLNIIKFPVSKYEGIYRAKKLGKTPYHIYSALLAHELAVFLANSIGSKNADESYSIGVISPYRAQADLIERLLERAELPPNVGVQVGTIHGFQGDECNMIIAVFNPPPVISDNKGMFLNKLNIINVSISRARDCLIVFMPDEETENIEKLKRVNKVEKLIKSSCSYREYNADTVEEMLFGRTCYLEENTFSTSHQNVNVYGLPEKRYEIRSEDNALDVQILEENSH